MYTSETPSLSGKQLKILRILMEKPYLQNKLQEKMGFTAPNLFYHLGVLEKERLIKKETIQKVGNARINEVSIEPKALQYIRRIFGNKIDKITLFTGFGLYETGYRIPDIIMSLLKELHYPISKIVCFTTKEAYDKRLEFKIKEQLLELDRVEIYDYEKYRNVNSDFFTEVEQILIEEMKDANILIDITPLSKFYSFKFLELANKFKIPCFYIGKDEKSGDVLYSLSNMEFNVKFDVFKMNS